MFVSGAGGSFSGLNLRDGTQRFRCELAQSVTALCRRSGALWLTLADGRAVSIDPASGQDLGAPATPGAGSQPSGCEPMGQVGVRAADLAPAAVSAAIPAIVSLAPGERLVAATEAAALVAFPSHENDKARVVAFDVPSGRQRWEAQVAPHTLSALAASAHHLVLTWSGGTPRYTSITPYVLMVLGAATGDRVTQVGGAAYFGR